MGWIIALVILLALFFLPIGVCAIYRQSNAGIWLLIGPFKFRVFPGNKESNKTKRQGENKTQNNLSKGGDLHLPSIFCIFSVWKVFMHVFSIAMSI